jgi:hypothetical protein
VTGGRLAGCAPTFLTGFRTAGLVAGGPLFDFLGFAFDG